MKKKIANSVVNIIIIAYISIMLADIVVEKIKELWLYLNFLQNPPLKQFQTDFIKESVKMSQKGIASKLNELQGFVMGLLLSTAKVLTKSEKQTIEPDKQEL